MKAVILAAGRGLRIGALTKDAPKPMVAILGRPLLEWKLRMLPPSVDEIILIIGYRGQVIREHFGTKWQGRRIRYVVQETLNGTGGALHLAREFLTGKTLIMMGDDFYHPLDLGELILEEAAVLGFAVDHAAPFGLLERDAAGRLTRITERPHGRARGVVNAGAYVLDQHFFGYPLVPVTEAEFGLPQTIALMGQEIPVVVRLARDWVAIGCPEDIPAGEAFLRRLQAAE